MTEQTRCGFIAIIGRPNVGKSTLLNHIVGEKVSIISKKPQTTRHKILGIKTEGENQLVFVDTPGLHKNPKHKINQLMIKAALSSIRDVDVIVFMVNKQLWTEDDAAILKRLSRVKIPVIIAINKIDRIKDKSKLLPIIENLQTQCTALEFKPLAIIPICAKFGEGTNELEKLLIEQAQVSPHFFPKDQSTDKNELFWCSEIIREKLMRLLGEEIPHTLTVEIEQLKKEEKLIRIHGLIWVERPGQKNIVIGAKGEVLKQVGTLARKEMETYFGQKVFLQLWVKVKSGWTDDLRALRNLGYGD